MFASICIQLQELTKEKPRSEGFFSFCFLTGTLKKNSYLHGILINNTKKVAEIRGEGNRVRRRGR